MKLWSVSDKKISLSEILVIIGVFVIKNGGVHDSGVLMIVGVFVVLRELGSNLVAC